jgi:hypothetical protein
MDDLTSFVEGMVSHLGRAFFLAGFIPALILIAVNQYLIFSPTYAGADAVWNLFPELGDPWLGLFTGAMLTTVVAALALGLVLVVLNNFIIRLFEGLVPGVRTVLFPFYLRNIRRHRDRYAPIVSRQEEHRAIIARMEETGEYEEEADFAVFEALEHLHAEREQQEPVQQLPYLRQRVSPTAFGNVWAIMEEYPLRRYGIDGVLFWPYVREVISQRNERLLEEIDNQKLLIDVVINLALVMGILMLEGLIFALVRFQWQMLVVAVIALVLFLLLYEAGVSYSRALATLITKGYDLYRLPVLDAFGLARPDDLDEEYWTWSRLAAFLRRGEPFYFEMLDRHNGSEDQAQS